MSISISKRNEGSVTFRDAAGYQPIENLISSRLGAVLEAAGRPYAPKFEDVCSRLLIFGCRRYPILAGAGSGASPALRSAQGPSSLIDHRLT